MKIVNYNFVKTCDASPEQYDVFDDQGKQVAYVRLRWGCLTAKYPDVGGKIIYDAGIGDGFTGRFRTNKERYMHLMNIAKAIDYAIFEEEFGEEFKEE